MVKQLVFENDAREAVLRGVAKLAKAVVSTLGPRGRNAVLDKGWGGPQVTKDGVTVAEEIELDDRYENMGAKLVKEAASQYVGRLYANNGEYELAVEAWLEHRTGAAWRDGNDNRGEEHEAAAGVAAA